jgi:hypothetical protein
MPVMCTICYPVEMLQHNLSTTRLIFFVTCFLLLSQKNEVTLINKIMTLFTIRVTQNNFINGLEKKLDDATLLIIK